MESPYKGQPDKTGISKADCGGNIVYVRHADDSVAGFEYESDAKRFLAGLRQRPVRNAQRWRTGCEGRICHLKCRHGLNRRRYKGLPLIQRWVGLGVIADNPINIGHALAGNDER